MNSDAKYFDTHAQKTFLANWRHELRTPLNALIGYSEMLSEDVEELDLTEMNPELQAIHGASKELLTSVNNILAPTILETGQAPLDLEIIRITLDNELRRPVETILEAAQQLVETAERLKQWGFLADLRKIYSAAEQFMKLLDETFTAPQAEIEVLEPDSPPTSVSNSIEEPKHLMNSPEEMTSAMPSKGSLLLVVDDNEMNRDVLSRHLTRQGYEVLTARNGEEALEMIHAQTFELVLLDIIMPKMNGYQVLQQLKQKGLLHALPVIMISALDELNNLARCVELGAEDFLSKPFDPVLLKARIRSCLEKKRLRDLSVEYLQNLAWLAEENTKEQAKFMRIMVHELKSPVSASKMMADLMSYYPLDNPKIAHLPGKISARMDQLLQLIRDLLRLAKVKSGDFLSELTVFDLVGETAKECELYRTQAKEKGLAFHFKNPEEPLYVRFDAQGYNLIFSNLASNAVKYTSSGFVNITLKRQESWAVLEVSDSGIGIPEEDIPQLFQEFFRASNAKKQKIQGTGVGLAGVKHIVERHGGQLDFQSRENKGSTFSIRLPLHQD
ncbi:MAG: response regulator [bacterium]|nr:response regulator [bacterium]